MRVYKVTLDIDRPTRRSDFTRKDWSHEDFFVIAKDVDQAQSKAILCVEKRPNNRVKTFISAEVLCQLSK